jgi:dihydrofolate reductase
MERFYFSSRFHKLILQSHLFAVQKRCFAIKELSWCLTPHSVTKTTKMEEVSNQDTKYCPINQFGIVAAMSKNNIIGIKGHLPWNLPADREEFVQLTKNKILIIGRKTLEERPTLSHISHAAHCIVVSRNMQNEPSSIANSDTQIQFARSIPESLDIARRIVDGKSMPDNSMPDNSNDLDCWVAGGEGIYNMAVLHPSALTMHLTVIDIDIDISSYSMSEVARFPPKYHWDTRFTECSTKFNVANADNAITFTI